MKHRHLIRDSAGDIIRSDAGDAIICETDHLIDDRVGGWRCPLCTTWLDDGVNGEPEPSRP